MGSSAIILLVLSNLSTIVGFGIKLYRVIKRKESVEQGLVGMAESIEQISASYRPTKGDSHHAATKAAVAHEVVKEVKQAVAVKQTTLSPEAAAAIETAVTIADPKKPNPTFA